ncbi:ATP-binding cassette domain-containing protein, partial [Streptosporangium sp. NPDC006013]|uniref:ATP-binding cassette domain-containing protein n=1 Tax=Streptosporangium sp. NPDC006013 TaxID=3155596 RepID=UPI0033A2FE11
MIIEAHDLRKTFTARRGRGRTEQVEAVRGVDLSVAEGEIFAVLGPNGAGKTTTVRMLTTLVAPTSGSARVAGHDVTAEAASVREKIGYVGQAGGV